MDMDMDMRLEVIVLPVTDVDRAKGFCKALGWREDADLVTAPGSAEGLQLIVSDIEAARAELAEHGAGVSAVFHDEGGVFHHAGTSRRVPGPAPEHASYGSFLSFSDPDGNLWFVQEITTRLPGRVTAADGIPGAGA
jgi:catechol 2,3-dioxygenase-like lactoylglutathione lyase family enzyme